jgi:hypothetical protein
VLEKLKIKLLSYSLFVVVPGPGPWAWNIPAKNCLTMCIIAKDLTVQQRDQNKKRRAVKIKQQIKALKEKKTSGQ